MNPRNPRYRIRDPSKGRTQVSSPSLPTILLCGPVMCLCNPQRLVSHKPCLFKVPWWLLLRCVLQSYQEPQALGQPHHHKTGSSQWSVCWGSPRWYGLRAFLVNSIKHNSAKQIFQFQSLSRPMLVLEETMETKIEKRMGPETHRSPPLVISSRDFPISAQCYVTAWVGEEFVGEWIHAYICLSSFLSTETITTLVKIGYECHRVLSVQFSSVTQSCPTLCDPMNCSMPSPTPGVHSDSCPSSQ